MNIDAQLNLIDVINEAAIKLTDYSSLMEQIGDARFVMIGEASHGTHEFYQARIEITQQLIQEKGFMAVAIEGDWPDAYRVHRYIQGRSDDDSTSSLDDFKRFPTWMWRNTTMPPFLKWSCCVINKCYRRVYSLPHNSCYRTETLLTKYPLQIS